VAQHVLARLKVFGDLYHPCVVVLGHDIRGPGTRPVAGGRNLEEFKIRLVDILARAVAVGEVVDDRAALAHGPRILQL
jgi:hypothetical protein